MAEVIKPSQKSIMVFASPKIKSLLYSRYYVEACNELRRPTPRVSGLAAPLKKLLRNVTAVASRFDIVCDLTGRGIEPTTYSFLLYRFSCVEFFIN